ncbi:MAG: tetratricopeptide repeat protein [Candidatus Omnitrophota bacterium]|jgi:TolA-binding protein
MKKTLFSKIVFIFMVVFLVGCSSNDQYSVERKYWKIKKLAEKVFKNPVATPPNELERVVSRSEEFIKEYAANPLSIEASFNIARLYIVKEEYESARKQLQKILQANKKSPVICSEALFLIGNAYQLQDKWSLALEQYKKITREYPTTVKALDIPIFIAQNYKVKNQPEKMIVAYQDAIGQYRTLIETYPNSLLAFNAYLLVAQCHIALKDWQMAVKTFETVIEKFNGKAKMDGAMFEMAIIYAKQLKDTGKAKEILDRLNKEYPKSRYSKVSLLLIKELDKQ